MNLLVNMYSDYIPQDLFKALKYAPVNIDDDDDYTGFNFCLPPYYILRKVELKNTDHKKVSMRSEKKLLS